MRSASALWGIVSVLLSACQPPDPDPTPPPTTEDPVTTAEPRPELQPEPDTVAVQKGTITQMPLEQFFVLRGEDRTLVVDVRRSVMFALGHIDGAINLPLSSFESSLEKHRETLDAAVDAGKAIVLYCDGENCPDAHNTAKALAEKGYSTSIYRGGWAEWKEAGME